MRLAEHEREALDHVIAYYEGGGKVGISEYACVYFTPGGGHCAVGVLLKRAGMTACDYVGPVYTLMEARPEARVALQGLSETLLKRMQQCHDNSALRGSAAVADALRKLRNECEVV